MVCSILYKQGSTDDIFGTTNAIIFDVKVTQRGLWFIWQMPVSSPVTPFIILMGSFFYSCCVPFHITSAPEIYQKRITDILDNQDGTAESIDDILIFGLNVEKHAQKLNQVLHKVKKSGVWLSKDKCHIHQSDIQSQIRSEPFVTLLLQPTWQRWGLLCGTFLSHLSTVTKPMTALLKSTSIWLWDPHQEESFLKAKNVIISSSFLCFNVSTDASRPRYGNGAALFQNHEGQLKPAAFSWDITLLTDHKPLVSLNT